MSAVASLWQNANQMVACRNTSVSNATVYMVKQIHHFTWIQARPKQATIPCDADKSVSCEAHARIVWNEGNEGKKIPKKIEPMRKNSKKSKEIQAFIYNPRRHKYSHYCCDLVKNESIVNGFRFIFFFSFSLKAICLFSCWICFLKKVWFRRCPSQKNCSWASPHCRCRCFFLLFFANFLLISRAASSSWNCLWMLLCKPRAPSHHLGSLWIWRSGYNSEISRGQLGIRV